MGANIIFGEIPLYFLLRSPLYLVGFAFQIWMLIDAIRKREWGWVFFIVVFWGIGPLWYFFYVYRDSPSATRGFELPGAYNRQRIKELQAQIHHLDKAHHHSQLGDIYFQQSKLDKAEACYRAALERDPEDLDTRAHLGQCLLRQKKPAEARLLLEGVCRQDPKHDYCHSMMALAETYAALNDSDAAIKTLEWVAQSNSYARAKTQLAELYKTRGNMDRARELVREVLEDDRHAPAFQRRREKVWIKRAKSLLRSL